MSAYPQIGPQVGPRLQRYVDPWMLYFPYPGAWGGFLGEGQIDANLDYVPVGLVSLPPFVNAYTIINNSYVCSIASVMPTTAVVLWLNVNGPGNWLFALYMSPALAGPVGNLIYQELGMTNCPNVGPVIPAESAVAQGLSYIAVMPDMNRVRCLKSCMWSGTVGVTDRPLLQFKNW